MIITNNEELLRLPTTPVLLEEVGPLIELLENELNHANYLGNQGIGLAAPQIGIQKDIAIIRLGETKINLVNAKLQNGYDPTFFKDEGCLSFPGRVENTIRFQEVHITSNLVDPFSFTATGFLAVVCQHELDHLNSKLFIDHIAPKQNTIKVNKVSPNEKCPCGSGKKYKKCHYLNSI